jgi:hypothetical protein
MDPQRAAKARLQAMHLPLWKQLLLSKRFCRKQAFSFHTARPVQITARAVLYWYGLLAAVCSVLWPVFGTGYAPFPEKRRDLRLINPALIFCASLLFKGEKTLPISRPTD